MAIMRFDPFQTDLTSSLRLFDDAVSRFLGAPATRPWTPAVDIYETENELILKADLPEVKLEDIEIKMENGTLTLKGERKFESEHTERGYHRIERGYGSFVRAFTVPETIDPEKVNAQFQEGVLVVKLPKKEVAKPRTIKVDVAKS